MAEPPTGPRTAPLSTGPRNAVEFGELVVAAFDIAAQQTADPAKISRLATGAVFALLRRVQETSLESRTNTAVTIWTSTFGEHH